MSQRKKFAGVSLVVWAAAFAVGAFITNWGISELKAAAANVIQCFCNVNNTWECYGSDSVDPIAHGGGSLIPCVTTNGDTNYPQCTFAMLGQEWDYACAPPSCNGVCRFTAAANGDGSFSWQLELRSCVSINPQAICDCCPPTVAPTAADQTASTSCGFSNTCNVDAGGWSCSRGASPTCLPNVDSSTSKADCLTTCTPSGYGCVNGTCVLVPGSTQSLSQCEAQCGGYTCNNGTCEFGQGTTQTLQQCQQNCGGGYICQNNQCVYSQTGSDSLSTCQGKCGGGYVCQNGACVYSGTATATKSQCEQTCGSYLCDYSTGQCYAASGGSALGVCQQNCHQGYSCAQMAAGEAPVCTADGSSTVSAADCQAQCKCAGVCQWVWGANPGGGGCEGEVVWVVSGGQWIQKINNCKRGCYAQAPSTTDIPAEGIEAITPCDTGSSGSQSYGWQLTSNGCGGTGNDSSSVCGCDPPSGDGAIGTVRVTSCYSKPGGGNLCVGSKVFYPRETDNDPLADQDGDGDLNYLTVVVQNGDRDGDGCCDFQETYAGLNNPHIGCCYCSLWDEWYRAGGYVLTDRIDSHLHPARLLLPGDRGASSNWDESGATNGYRTMPTMITRLYWEVDFLSPIAPAGVTFPVVKIWVPLTIEDFASGWTTWTGMSSATWNNFINGWNQLRMYLRAGFGFVVGLYMMGLVFKEVRV